MNVLECALIWDPHLCVSLESLEKALAILSLYHRMDPRLRGWCQIDVVQGIMPDGSHYSMTAITFPSFTDASLSRQCVCA